MDPRETAYGWIAAREHDLSDWHRLIWGWAETSWREYRSAAWYAERLRAEGFEVEEGSGGMPTAFAATWSNGPGPAIGGYAEYDAVPGNGQAASTRREPRPGVSRFAPGHTDPHSALGIGSLGAFLAAKRAMEEHGIGGTLRYFGEPAEKVCGSKPVHGVRGYYDGLDAIISFHPFYMFPLCNTVRWDTHCGTYSARIYTFLCEEPETWQAPAGEIAIPEAHTVARAPGANAALFTMYGLTKTTTESMLAHVGGWSLNEAILTAGQATADNLPASLAQIQYAWRTPDVVTSDAVLAVLDRNADAAAAATHCRVEKRWVTRTRPGVANHVLAEVTYRNLEAAGPPRWGEEAVRVAREIQANLGLAPAQRPFPEALERLAEPREAERLLRLQMPAWQRNWTSDDYTEMTWCAPTVRLYVARPMLAGPPGYAYPDWVAVALGGIPATIDPTIVCSARTIAGTILELLRSPDVLAAARREFEERTGGDAWIAPLLPADFAPPIDFRWPEYVTTPRGESWWIPPSDEF